MHRHFKSIEEIHQEAGFAPDQAVSLENYAALLGWYELGADNSLACCVQRSSGTLCRTIHRRGWVARLKNNSVSIIGGHCATAKFGANSIIAGDIAVASNLRDESQRRQRLEAQLGDQVAMRAWCVTAVRELESIRGRIAGILDGVGGAASKLEDMARSGNGGVQILGVKAAKRDKDGKVLEDAVTIRIPIGRLRNVEACNRLRTGDIRARVNKLQQWCHRPMQELEQLRGRKLREAAAIFGDFPRLQRELTAHLGLLAVFEGNDFTPLAYVVREFSERAKVVRFAQNALGKATSKDGAKDWLIRYDQALKEQHGVNKLVIG